MDRLIHTRAALEACETHLKAARAEASQIESYLSEYLAVVLCADMQTAILGVVDEFAAKSCDKAIAGFVRSAVDRKFRSISIGDLTGLAGMFCPQAKEAFADALDERTSALYCNIVNERHKVAHTRSASITLRDLRSALDAANAILEGFASALDHCT